MNQFSTRIILIITEFVQTRQQHARLDLGKHGCHDQIFGSKLETHGFHQSDVLHVLRGNFRNRDVEYVEILAFDQVQQEIKRPFERIEKDFERIGRDIQIKR